MSEFLKSIVLKRRIKKLFASPSLVISIIALLLSALGVYFQFFNVRHSLLYSILTPELLQESQEIIIPVLIKNNGNQTEVILGYDLLLEVKEDSGSFFKRISQFNSKDHYSVLSPGEYRTINIVGNYKNYLLGTIKINYPEEADYEYSPIRKFDDLLLKIKLTFLTTYGNVAFEEREIGKITFNTSDKIERIDCEPIALIKLNLRKNDYQIVSYSIIPNYNIKRQIIIDLNDSASLKEYRNENELFDRILN